MIIRMNFLSPENHPDTFTCSTFTCSANSKAAVTPDSVRNLT